MRIPERKVYIPGKEKYIAYEAEKSRLQSLNLTNEEYEKAIRELSERLGV